MADEYSAMYETEPEMQESLEDFDEDLAARIEQRRREMAAKNLKKRKLTIVIFIVAFAFLATMCGKDIVRLKAENRALKKQQIALQKERDELKAELENTSEQEYIRDQARKQLRLLNPGELLFIFEDGEGGEGDGES